MKCNKQRLPLLCPGNWRSVHILLYEFHSVWLGTLRVLPYPAVELAELHPCEIKCHETMDIPSTVGQHRSHCQYPLQNKYVKFHLKDMCKWIYKHCWSKLDMPIVICHTM